MMTTAEIVAALLDNWGVEDWMPAWPVVELVRLVMARPVLLLEISDRIATCPVDRTVAEALAFHILDGQG